MSATPNGIAHVSYPGGGIFVPVRTAYDRQILVEQVMERVRTKGQVQILIDDRRWMVRHLSRASRVSCVQCGGSTNSACTSPVIGKAVFCTKCVVEGAFETPPAVTSVRPRTRSRAAAAMALMPSPA